MNIEHIRHVDESILIMQQFFVRRLRSLAGFSSSFSFSFRFLGSTQMKSTLSHSWIFAVNIYFSVQDIDMNGEYIYLLDFREMADIMTHLLTF